MHEFLTAALLGSATGGVLSKPGVEDVILMGHYRSLADYIERMFTDD